MYDLETEFKKFYYNYVVLPKDEVNNLRDKKNLNIDRLKEGLEEYNEENKTNYKIAETLEQGSVAMSTITQNENKDYDIDVAVVFDESNIDNIGSIAIKNIVVESLKKKCTNFKTEPEAKTNCVRIGYIDNYHIDFAIYKRIKNDDDSYRYEHAGSQWRLRDPRSINNWFRDEISKNGEKLRQAVRLSKMFCKSRESWNMPGGLIQSVLCDEKIQSYTRIDEMFYYTINEIKNRLEYNKNVCNPTDTSQSLILTKEDEDKITNLYNRLNTYISNLDILFNSDCDKQKAMESWETFFNHDYWSGDQTKALTEMCNRSINQYDDTEEYISNMFSVPPTHYFVNIDCRITKNTSTDTDIYLSNLLANGQKVPVGCNLTFYIKNTNISNPFDVYWKVKNEGEISKIQNCIRGQIFRGNLQNQEINVETSNFAGDHYVECYIIKDSVCLAKKRIDVPIR